MNCLFNKSNTIHKAVLECVLIKHLSSVTFSIGTESLLKSLNSFVFFVRVGFFS